MTRALLIILASTPSHARPQVCCQPRAHASMSAFPAQKNLIQKSSELWDSPLLSPHHPSSSSIRSSSSISDLLRSLRMVVSWSISSTRLMTSALLDTSGHHLLFSPDLFVREEYPGVPTGLPRLLPRRAGTTGGRGHFVHVPLLAISHQTKARCQPIELRQILVRLGHGQAVPSTRPAPASAPARPGARPWRQGEASSA